MADLVEYNGEYTGKAIADLFFKVLKKYGLFEKLQGMTVDNASENTKFIEELSILINNMFVTNFDPSDLHFRCLAYILNLVAQDLIGNLEIDDVRE